MKFRSGLLLLFFQVVVSFLLSLNIFANSRLDGVQRTYFEDVDAFISSELKTVFSRYFLLLNDARERSSTEFERHLSLVERNFFYAMSNATQDGDYKSLLLHQQNLNLANAKVAHSSHNVEDEYRRLEHCLSTVDQKSFCESMSRSKPFAGHPLYRLDERIDLRSIPELKHDNVKSWVGSENQNADQFEKNLYLPATTGGCIVAQALIPVPVLGCLIGFGAGIVTAFIAGRTGSVAITEYQNYQEWLARENAIQFERQRQEKLIDEARQWMTEHPIDNELVRSRSLKRCVNYPVAWQQQILIEAASWVTFAIDSSQALDAHASEMEAVRASMREEALEDLQQENTLIVKNRIQQLATSFYSADETTTGINDIRRSLSMCLLAESASCEGMAVCVDEAQYELDALSIQIVSEDLVDELRQIQSDLLLCKKERGL